MAAPVILVEATPRSTADGTPSVVRLAGGGALVPYHYGDQHWQAGLSGLPRSSAALDFDGEQLGGGGSGEAFELSWAPSSRAAMAALTALYWTDAPITVRLGPEGQGLPPIVTSGLVMETAVDGGALKIAFGDQLTDLKRPLLVDRFAGTGGIEGPPEFADIIKSRAWGRCFNVPGKQIDPANNIWCFGDPRRPWLSFDQVRDKGVPASNSTLTVLATQGTPEATFAALQATSAIEGGGVLCPSIACVKWWTSPGGDLHADIRGETAGGYVETAPEIVARLVAARSTIPFANGAVAAAAAARPAPFGWRVETDSATAAGEISDMLGGVSTSWLAVDGAIVFRHWDWTAPTRVARSFAVTRTASVKPTASRKLGYRRNWSPMARGDLAAFVLSTDVLYEDGTPIEDLKPATPGATAGAPQGTTIGGAIQPDGSIAGGLPAKVTIDALAELAGTPDASTIIERAKASVARAKMALASQLSSQLLGQDRKDRYERLMHLDGVELSTRVVHEIVQRQEGDAAIVERTDLIEATASDGIAAAQASILEEASVRASAHAAETAQREQAISTVLANLNGERLIREAEIARVETTSATDLEAKTSQLEAAISTVEVAIGDERLDREAAIVDERTTRADQLSAATSELHTAISTVELLINGERQDRQAAITEERTTSADENGALAHLLTNLASQVGENEASIQFLLETTNGEQAIAQLSVNVNGEITGFKINGAEQLFVVAADRFVIGNSNIFEVDTTTGVTKMKSVEVDTIKVGTGYSNDLPIFTKRSDPLGGVPDFGWQSVISVDVPMSGPGSIVVQSVLRQSFPNGDRSWTARLKIAGEVVFAAGGAKTADTTALAGAHTVAGAGTYSVTLDTSTDASVSAGDRTLIVTRFYGAPAA